MRIVFDFQGAQFNRLRGIGRYTTALVSTMAKLAPQHEIFVVLNAAAASTIDPIRADLAGLVPEKNILTWSAPTPVRWLDPDNLGRTAQAELVREAFIAALQPDWVVVSSLFEGLIDDAVTSIGVLRKLPTAVILYDLIPWIYPDIYLKDPRWGLWYYGKIDQLKRADLLLAISDSSGREAVEWLEFDPAQVAPISTAAGDHFRPLALTADDRRHLDDTYGLHRPFVMYTGGIDHRKNLDRMIEAYAGLPADVRRDHQLAIVCAASPEDMVRLHLVGEKHGLTPEDLVVTGFVPEDDLVLLYNAATLVVFPSWHEGFGLPVLEAMMCGKPVIASDRASLPEVVGREDALFDPYDVADITRHLQRALSDDAFRDALTAHALPQSRKFSWEATARKAWDALERAFEQRKAAAMPPGPPVPYRPRLAFFSPLPPERSGISDYSAELLRELTRFYRVDVFVRFPREMTDLYVRANCNVLHVDDLAAHALHYDRVLYHFGNSEFHEHMFRLLPEFPGVVVLHDFFLSGVQQYSEVKGWRHHPWASALLEGHGYEAVVHRFVEEKDATPVVLKWPTNFPVLRDALGVIVHSEAGRQLARDWYGDEMADDWKVIPLLREHPPVLDREGARRRLGVASDELVVCSYGILAEPKLSHRIIEAWKRSRLADDPKARLVFVGREHPDYKVVIAGLLRNDPKAERIEVTGFVETETYRDWLLAADVAVQLRAQSRGETSAAVLDCMNYGLPTIANAHGSMAELDASAVWMLPDEFSDEELQAAIETLASDRERRLRLADSARAVVRTQHSPRRCAEAYFEAMEAYSARAAGTRALMESLAPTVHGPAPELARALARNLPPRFRFRRLLVDVTALAQPDTDPETVRIGSRLLRSLFAMDSNALRIEPIQAMRGAPGFLHARRFTCRFLGIFADWAEDEPVEAWDGDVYLGLDFESVLRHAQAPVLEEWRHRGVRTLIMVQHLLPPMLPGRFDPDIVAAYRLAAEVVAQADVLATASPALRDELRDWLDGVASASPRGVQLAMLPLGTEAEDAQLARRAAAELAPVVAPMQDRASLLLTGTIAPRNGIELALAAFDRAWAAGADANLVIVETGGPRDESLGDRLREHREFGRRLFWIENASPAVLAHLYPHAAGVLIASEGEGTPLLLLEAQREGKPGLVRDLPVFRAAADAGTRFFPDTENADALAEAIRQWLRDRKSGILKAEPPATPRAWADTAREIIALARGERTGESWQPSGQRVQRFRGNDVRTSSEVGVRHGRILRSDGAAGWLLQGPAMRLARGRYRIGFTGRAEAWTGTERLEIVSEEGERTLLRLELHDMPAGAWTLERELVLHQDQPDVEVRFWIDAATRLQIDTFEVEQLSTRTAAREAMA